MQFLCTMIVDLNTFKMTTCASHDGLGIYIVLIVPIAWENGINQGKEEKQSIDMYDVNNCKRKKEKEKNIMACILKGFDYFVTSL